MASEMSNSFSLGLGVRLLALLSSDRGGFTKSC